MTAALCIHLQFVSRSHAAHRRVARRRCRQLGWWCIGHACEPQLENETVASCVKGDAEIFVIVTGLGRLELHGDPVPASGMCCDVTKLKDTKGGGAIETFERLA